MLRCDVLDPGSGVALFSELTAHFQSLVKFPDSILEGLTDERYLRNVVEVIFRSPGAHQRQLNNPHGTSIARSRFGIKWKNAGGE